MRKLKYYVAMTLDGFICRRDGSFDCFPAEGGHVAEYLESLKSFDVVLMGRKTYEVGLKVGVTSPYPALKQYVFSRTLKQSPDEQVTLVSRDATELVQRLKNEPGKDIYLCGGADLATHLFTAKLIDEIVIKLNPLLLGSGIPLFSGKIAETNLKLTHSKVFGSGVVFLHYAVRR
ncbi:MAG: dihydrofolate reductase family protein [Verrucomicrobia subdivision 3 bacterium]|nr:dihydrofolate reductase family protein [Limisphaerales bacterium]